MRRTFFSVFPPLSVVAVGLWLMPVHAHAMPAVLTFRYEHFLFTAAPAKYPEWQTRSEQWTYDGQVIAAPESLRVDGDVPPALPPGMHRESSIIWNKPAIREDLAILIAAPMQRAAGNVIINRTGSGVITFTGVGLPGRDTDLDTLVDLTVQALDQNLTDVEIPMIVTQPTITVLDPKLKAEGINEVVTVGESDFSNSPKNRRHNIAVGLAKFNGHLIPKDTIFSFTGTLGRVDGSTGYLKELVIKGDRTEPDYGGGLCQVSSTAYRGVWEYGFPITDRRNHSYTVNHYAPKGTDATVYPGSADMKFLNNSPGSLLIQTYADGDLAYFIYYGTKDTRRTQVLGPYTWGSSSPPPDRTEYTTDLAPGEKKKLGERVPGVKALWYRITKRDGKPDLVESVFSNYEARPLYYLIGVESLPGTQTGSLLGGGI